jgi:uncharacterized protein YbgA (DUF1722 family)
LFGQELKKKFPYLPITDEGRLENMRLREDFLFRIYTHARFRKLNPQSKISELVQFHTENKLIFMAFNQSKLQELGRIVANSSIESFSEILKQYESKLSETLALPATFKTHINVLLHAFGYFKKQLNSEEKQFFLQQLNMYQKNVIPLSSCIGVLKSWIIRFKTEYLQQQRYFNPFPSDLMFVRNKENQ